MRGTYIPLSMTQKEATQYYYYFRGKKSISARATKAAIEEYAVVGLKYEENYYIDDPFLITENMIRAEHGLKTRMQYGGSIHSTP